MKKPRYVLKPGFLNPEKRQGFMTSRALASLYGVNEQEYAVWDPTEPASKYMGQIPLSPRPKGDYREYITAVDRFAERLDRRFASAVKSFEGKSQDETARLIGDELIDEIRKMENEGWFPDGFCTDFAIAIHKGPL